ncbi:hypothetical protein CL617_04640 [archaeon]|nr:hypothetical protein [archaeon]
MKRVTWILIIVLLLVASSILLIKNRNESRAVGADFLTEDEIEFQKADLKTCCFYEENNENKACRILKRYDCSVCSSKCDS